jgi:hypothetical protein
MKSILMSAFVLTAAPALAQEIPRLDVAEHCEAIGSIGGFLSARLESDCIEIEQEAYDRLKPEWSQLSRSTRERCLDIAASGEFGSYQLLEGCIELEGETVSDKQEFKY